MVLQELRCNANCLFYSYWYWNILVNHLRQFTKFTVYMEHKITVSLAHFKPNYLW